MTDDEIKAFLKPRGSAARFAMNDVERLVVTNAERLGDGANGLALGAPSNEQRPIGGHYFHAADAALLCRIGHVVRLTAAEQVRRPNAPRVVAAVANGHALWDWSIYKLPRKSVRGHSRSSVSGPLGAVQNAIAIPITGPRPSPAGIATGICVDPESIDGAYAAMNSHIGAISIADAARHSD